MFDSTQVQSYNQIKAPAELKQRVMEACENREAVKVFSWQKATVRLAPLAACLLLFIGVLTLNHTEPLQIQVENAPVTEEYRTLSCPDHTGNNSLIRTISLAPTTYTVTISLNQPVEIISAQGNATIMEDGSIEWTVTVPYEDTLFELFLQSEDGTYYVPLQYHVNNGSFSIRCEKQ